MTPPSELQKIEASAATDVDALTIVTQNYKTCNANRDRLIELQGWVKDQSEVRE